MRSKPSSVADYLAKSPPEVRRALKQLRALVRAAAPRTTEKISYGIPMFVLNGTYLVYIAGFKDHVSLYPVTKGLTQALKKEMEPYRSGKGTLRFPLGKPVPKTLIRKVVKVRVGEVMARAR